MEYNNGKTLLIYLMLS